MRERIEDLPSLAQRILDELEQELQLPKKASISPEDMTRLCAYRWPGNIRELRNVLERALIVSPGPQLTFDSFQPDPGVGTCAAMLEQILDFPVSSATLVRSCRSGVQTKSAPGSFSRCPRQQTTGLQASGDNSLCAETPVGKPEAERAKMTRASRGPSAKMTQIATCL